MNDFFEKIKFKYINLSSKKNFKFKIYKSIRKRKVGRRSHQEQEKEKGEIKEIRKSRPWILKVNEK